MHYIYRMMTSSSIFNMTAIPQHKEKQTIQSTIRFVTLQYNYFGIASFKFKWTSIQRLHMLARWSGWFKITLYFALESRFDRVVCATLGNKRQDYTSTCQYVTNVLHINLPKIHKYVHTIYIKYVGCKLQRNVQTQIVTLNMTAIYERLLNK